MNKQAAFCKFWDIKNLYQFNKQYEDIYFLFGGLCRMPAEDKQALSKILCAYEKNGQIIRSENGKVVVSNPVISAEGFGDTLKYRNLESAELVRIKRDRSSLSTGDDTFTLMPILIRILEHTSVLNESFRPEMLLPVKKKKSLSLSNEHKEIINTVRRAYMYISDGFSNHVHELVTHGIIYILFNDNFEPALYLPEKKTDAAPEKSKILHKPEISPLEKFSLNEHFALFVHGFDRFLFQKKTSREFPRVKQLNIKTIKNSDYLSEYELSYSRWAELLKHPQRWHYYRSLSFRQRVILLFRNMPHKETGLTAKNILSIIIKAAGNESKIQVTQFVRKVSAILYEEQNAGGKKKFNVKKINSDPAAIISAAARSGAIIEHNNTIFIPPDLPVFFSKNGDAKSVAAQRITIDSDCHINIYREHLSAAQFYCLLTFMDTAPAEYMYTAFFNEIMGDFAFFCGFTVQKAFLQLKKIAGKQVTPAVREHLVHVFNHSTSMARGFRFTLTTGSRMEFNRIAHILHRYKRHGLKYRVDLKRLEFSFQNDALWERAEKILMNRKILLY